MYTILCEYGCKIFYIIVFSLRLFKLLYKALLLNTVLLQMDCGDVKLVAAVSQIGIRLNPIPV